MAFDYLPVTGAISTATVPAALKALSLAKDVDPGIGIAEAMPMKFLMETRVEDIARDADILHKYHAAGVIHLYMELEASTDEMLASLNKGTDMDMNQRALDLAREKDLTTETWESVEKTIEVAIRLNPDIAVFPVITPMPFTPIHEEYKDLGGTLSVRSELGQGAEFTVRLPMDGAAPGSPA
jgi:radical SAM superfamily enzyme YgiQ (UPF0313 family)